MNSSVSYAMVGVNTHKYILRLHDEKYSKSKSAYVQIYFCIKSNYK